MNLKKILFLFGVFVIFAFLSNLTQSVPARAQLSPGTYVYGGMISNITSSSITLYGGVTVYITKDTKCTEPSSSGSAPGVVNISCSAFKTGETVRIEAVKNSSGELIAALIQEYFA